MKFKILIPVLFLLVTLHGCKKKKTQTTTGCTVVTVSSDITTATSWTEGNVYIVDHTLSITATLTIQPGTIIKFTGGNGLKTLTNGVIQAEGTAAKPIIFTAYTDDSFCGDNNGDGNASSPAKGYW